MTQNAQTPVTNDAINVVFEQIKQVKNNLHNIQIELNHLKQINNNIVIQYQNTERIHELNYRRIQDMALMFGLPISSDENNQQSIQSYSNNDNDLVDGEMPAKRRKLDHYTERERQVPRPILPRPTLLPAPANSAIDNQYAILQSRNDPSMPIAPPSSPNNSPPQNFTKCFDEEMSNHYYDIDGFYDF